MNWAECCACILSGFLGISAVKELKGEPMTGWLEFFLCFFGGLLCLAAYCHAFEQGRAEERREQLRRQEEQEKQARRRSRKTGEVPAEQAKQDRSRTR